MSRELPVSEIGEGPRFYPVEVPPAPHFHPELGYLLPSPLLGRRLRKAGLAALVGSAIVASTALALMPRPAIEGIGDAEPPIAAAPQSAPTEPLQPVAIEVLPAMRAPRTQPPPRAQDACDDLSTAFLATECRSGRVGKARLAHARAGHKLATVTIGRAIRQPEREEPASQTAAPSAADATAKTPAVSPPGAVPAKPKSPAKTVRRERPREEASADAGVARGNSSEVASPRFVLPSLFGGADWARSW